MVHLWMDIGFVFPKYGPIKVVYDNEYMEPTNFVASFGNPKSIIIARNRAWSIDPKALLKSMNSR
jgi:hypothetical protein